jgi:hypothetical protein
MRFRWGKARNLALPSERLKTSLALPSERRSPSHRKLPNVGTGQLLPIQGSLSHCPNDGPPLGARGERRKTFGRERLLGGSAVRRGGSPSRRSYPRRENLSRRENLNSFPGEAGNDFLIEEFLDGTVFGQCQFSDSVSFRTVSACGDRQGAANCPMLGRDRFSRYRGNCPSPNLSQLQIDVIADQIDRNPAASCALRLGNKHHDSHPRLPRTLSAPCHRDLPKIRCAGHIR